MALIAQGRTLRGLPWGNREEKYITPFSLEEIMRGTRYHEAGHAVAAYHHGYPITRVRVTDAECITNYRTPNPSSEFYGWADLWREACIRMSGMLADQRAMFGEMRPESWADFLAKAEAQLEVVEGGEDWLRSDHSDLLQLLQQMSADPKERKREELYWIVVDDSQRLITDHWAEIEAVARALEQKSTLEGPEVVLLIQQASRKEERIWR